MSDALFVFRLRHGRGFRTGFYTGTHILTPELRNSLSRISRLHHTGVFESSSGKAVWEMRRVEVRKPSEALPRSDEAWPGIGEEKPAFRKTRLICENDREINKVLSIATCYLVISKISHKIIGKFPTTAVFHLS